MQNIEYTLHYITYYTGIHCEQYKGQPCDKKYKIYRNLYTHNLTNINSFRARRFFWQGYRYFYVTDGTIQYADCGSLLRFPLIWKKLFQSSDFCHSGKFYQKTSVGQRVTINLSVCEPASCPDSDSELSSWVPPSASETMCLYSSQIIKTLRQRNFKGGPPQNVVTVSSPIGKMPDGDGWVWSYKAEFYRGKLSKGKRQKRPI